MAIERLAPDNLLLQTSLAGALSAVTDDPDSPDATFLTAPTLQAGATTTLYFLDTQPTGTQGYGMQENGTAPTTNNFNSSTSTSGWNTGQVTAQRYSWLDYNTQVARTALLSTEPAAQLITTSAAGNFFRSPIPYTGTFASGNWSIQMGVSGTATADFTLRWHVWATTDPTGVTGARRLNSSVIVGATVTTNLTTSVVQNVTATWAAPAVTLAGEYLFFTPYLHMTVAGTGNAQFINLVRAAASRVVTTSLTSSEPDTRLRVSFPTPTENPTLGAGLQEFRALVRRKGAGSPTATLALYENGAQIATLAGPTAVTNNTGQLITGTFDATGRAPASIEADLLGSGVVGGSVEVGAIEWNADTTAYIIGGGFLPSRQALFGGSLDVPIYNTDVRVSFPTPGETLVAAEAAQEFRVLVRKKGSGSDPTATIYLYEAGVQVGSALLGPTAVSNTSGVVLSATWNASILSGGLSGVNVECRVVGTGASGGTLEVGAIEWNALAFTPQIVHEPLSSRATLFEGGALRADPITISGGFIPSRQALFGGVVLSGVIQGGFIGGRMTADSRIMAFRQPPPKNRAELFGGALTESAGGSNRARVTPNQLISLSHLQGTLAEIQDDPDSPSDDWLEIS